jgi:hypothetical protein
MTDNIAGTMMAGAVRAFTGADILGAGATAGAADMVGMAGVAVAARSDTMVACAAASVVVANAVASAVAGAGRRAASAAVEAAVAASVAAAVREAAVEVEAKAVGAAAVRAITSRRACPTKILQREARNHRAFSRIYADLGDGQGRCSSVSFLFRGSVAS